MGERHTVLSRFFVIMFQTKAEYAAAAPQAIHLARANARSEHLCWPLVVAFIAKNIRF